MLATNQIWQTNENCSISASPSPHIQPFYPDKIFLNIRKKFKNIHQHNHNSKQWKMKKKPFLWNQVYIKVFETTLESIERNS